MEDSSQVSEHLRVIRSLMERANIYRAISAPTALVAGALALVSAPVLPMVARRLERCGEALVFCLWWVGVLALVLGFNAASLWRGARRAGRPFVSPAMGMALRSLLPSAVLGVFLTAFLFSGARSDAILYSVLWPCVYGVGLLGTQHFAPRSMVALGWAFLTFGIVLAAALVLRPTGMAQPIDFACAMMATSFGAMHVVYAAAVWLSRRGGEGAGESGEEGDR